MPLRRDVWTHDSCLVCQTMHSTEEDKGKHELDASHKKKVVVYDFLSKELSCLTPSNKKSLLYERYYRANACVAGLDCICELNFSWSAAPLWACTICYVSGESLESADDHMHSSYHKRNYICEYHPDRYANLLRVQEKSAKNKQSLLEQEAIVDTLCESKGLLAPDVYVLNERSQEWAFQKLGLANELRNTPYIAENLTDNHKIALCYICGETFISFMKEEEFRDALFTHLSTNIHQRCKAMHTLVHEDSLVECSEVPVECVLNTNSEFRRDDEFGDGAHYGPTVGLEHLIIYNGNECFCSLCFTILPKSSITAHFSSEYHIERFFRRDDPGKLLNTQYLSVGERHGILTYCHEEQKSTSHKYFRSTAQIPLLLTKYAFPERRSLVKYKLEEVDLGNSIKAIWCEECKEYVNTAGDENSWSIHIFDDSHFERAANKALCHYEWSVVTRSCAVLDNFVHSYPPAWDEQFSVSLGVLSFQDHCEFGLEFIIRDALSAKLCCTCCFIQCDDNDTQMFSKHARSLEHITRAMHSLNKKIMVTLNWRFPNVKDRKPLFMDYLVHCRKNLRKQKHGVSVYNPALRYKLNCSSALPKRLFELSKIAPNDRINFITAQKEKGTPEMVPLDVALNECCKIEVKLEDKEVIVCHCEECYQSFSEKVDKLDRAVEEHLLSLSHWERTKILDDNPFDESQRIQDKESKIKVPPFKQPDPKKKVTWKWNDKKACYEFVFAQLGLEDIRERRHLKEGKTDFFCTLCAQSFKATKLDLECHIRSFSHLFYFMHRHRPAIIPELQAQITANLEVTEKHKNIRRLFARTLKGCETEKKQCGIAIYDFEERECEYMDVKKALEEDQRGEAELRGNDDGKKSTTDPPAYEICNLNVIRNRMHNQQKWPNSEALDKHLTALLSDACMDNTGIAQRKDAIVRSLELAKKQLLDLVHFDGMVQLEDGNSGANSTSTLSVVNGMERQQTEQTKEPVEKPKEASAQLKGKEANTPEASSVKRLSTGGNTATGTHRSRETERWSSRRTRTPSPRQRSRHRSRSSAYQRRSDRGRSRDHRRSKDSRSPSPKRVRRERKGNDGPAHLPSSHSRSKSACRGPPPRTNTSPIPYESAKQRLDNLKRTLTNNDTPRQFFPLPPALKQKRADTQPLPCASEKVALPPPPPGPVPPVPSSMKKSVGGAYDASLLEEACPDLLRKSTAAAALTSEPQIIEDEPEEMATSTSSGRLNDKDIETNRADEPEAQLRNQLMNRLKKEARKDVYQQIKMTIPKGLPAFKQQALIRQKAEEMQKSRSPTKKFGAGSQSVVELQEKQINDRQEEERLQAISPEPDDLIEIVGHQQQQQQMGSDQRQQQKQQQQRDVGQQNVTMTRDLSKSRWDWVNGKFVLADPCASQSPNTRSSAANAAPSTPNQQGMATPKVVVDPPRMVVSSNPQQAQNVLSQLAMSTSAVTAQQILSEQQQSLHNVRASPIPGSTLPMLQPNMPNAAASVRSTNLPGHQHPMPSSLMPFGGGAPPIPSNILGTISPAIGVSMALPPRFNQPVPMMGFPPPMQQHPAMMMNSVEMIMCSKMQLYSRDLASIDNIAALIEYMWKQGYEPISPGDPPLLFNEVLSKRKGMIGANTLYQIICFGHPELETYYCGMCNHWTTVSEMFNHLRASMHRLSYMFRNYKMYHRKAMEELDEEQRDLLLERFASKIWEIESCGRCTNRMRCILNEDAIRRIWPDYINCVDSSWKIMDDDEEAELGRSQRGPLPVGGCHQPQLLAHSSTDGEPIAEPTVFADQSTVRAASAQVRASIVAKKLELAERAGRPGIGLVKLNSDKRLEEIDKNAVNSKEKKRNADGSAKSERRRDNSKERTKQSSSNSSSRSKRSRSRERHEMKGVREGERSRRRRSRSNDTGTRADRNKERDRSREERSDESWVEKAAQFLHKIGDTANATKLYWAASEEANVGPSGVDQDNNAKADKGSSVGPSQSTRGSSSLAERLASSSQLVSRRREQIDEREVRRQLSPERTNVMAESTRMEKQRQQQQKRPAMDDKSEMRKAIAVMVELQQEYENNNGYLSAEMFFNTCQEFSIAPDQVVNNKLLCETANELRVDLRAGLQAFVQHSQQPQGQFNLQSMGVDASKLRGLDPRSLQSILSKVSAAKHMSPPPRSSPSTKAVAPSPLRSRFEMQDIALDESMAPGNYVYPSYEEEGAGQQRRQAKVDIDTNINRLTYAFRSAAGQDVRADGSKRTEITLAATGDGLGATPQRRQQQVMKNPDLRRIAEEVGDDWNSLESFSFEMLGFGPAGGQVGTQPGQHNASHPSPFANPSP